MSGLSHLDELEAEAIYIIREVAAECEKPVMLYSIGKDSSVMLHLALKAFYPEKPPFPFPHLRSLVLRIPGMVFITERKDSLLSTALFFITAAASKGCGKSVFVEGLLESLCLHDISISGSISK